ncbi:MAG: hypothetical protein WCP55_13915, partial [Lentisphaerota bacterium]
MIIDAHTHGWHVDLGANGKPIPPMMPTWSEKNGPAADYVKKRRDEGLESVVILDPPEITFKLHEMLGDFIIPVPQVDLDLATPDDINGLFQSGARGIKFIVPMKSYGHDDYLPLYEAVLKNRGLAVFHTGYVVLGIFEPGGVKGRKS